MHRKALESKRKLDDLFNKVSAFSNDIELQSQWSRYLCILVSGLMEVAIVEIYVNYVEKRSAPNVANYVSNQLDLQNPKMEKILTLVGSFSLEWRREIENQPNFDEMKAAVDSIVDNRNKIAHGENVGISYVNVKKYYEQVAKLLQILYDQSLQ